MRQGQNPAKMGLKAYQAKQLGVALLSYIPNQEGYFKNSLEILRYQIASLHAATSDFDLLVFDNGSCPEVREELLRLYTNNLIHILFLSQFNVGKVGAINWLLSAMPNDWICYSDGDMFFRPGWLENSLAIFDAFPSAGLVFAQPTLFDTLRGTGQAQHQLEADARYRLSNVIVPAETVREYTWGFGINSELEKELLETTVCVAEEKSSGIRAVVAGAHNQFLVRREVARRIIPLPAQLALSPIEDSAFNRRVDELGLLQLSTFEPFTFHVGNRLDDWTHREIDRLGLENVLLSSGNQRARSLPASVSRSKQTVFSLLRRISKLAFIDTFLRRVYNLLFEFYAK
ncbi:MAG: glycosyltransferase family A protein [Anaerolineales bacterium]